MDIRITFFGRHHGPASDAHITLDLRDHFPLPRTEPSLRTPAARDRKAIRALRRIPGIRQLLTAIVDQVQAYAHSPAADQPLRIAVRGSGGCHRAGTVTHLLTRRLRRRGHTVTAQDRDVHALDQQPA